MLYIIKNAIIIFVLQLLLLTNSLIYAGDYYYKLSGNIGLVSRYIPMSGTQVGDGNGFQSGAAISIKGFKAYLWSNYGIPDKAFTEIDYGIEYTDKIYDALNASIGFHKYNFPESELYNWNLEVGTYYTGKINVETRYTYCIDEDSFLSGGRLYAKIEKIIIKNNASVLLYPYISTAYHWGYYGWQGFGHITSGMRFLYKVNDFIAANALLSYQISSNNINQKEDNFLYGGVGLYFEMN